MGSIKIKVHCEACEIGIGEYTLEDEVFYWASPKGARFVCGSCADDLGLLAANQVLTAPEIYDQSSLQLKLRLSQLRKEKDDYLNHAIQGRSPRARRIDQARVPGYPSLSGGAIPLLAPSL